LVVVDRSPWYRWALERLGLEYRHDSLGIRSRVERFFRYLKEMTSVFHHKMSARDYTQGIKNLNLSNHNILLSHESRRWVKCSFGHYRLYEHKILPCLYSAMIYLIMTLT